ncbi:MAG: response regulator transcription factor [Candidatus Aminicenantes bacterium]|nr:response regulator transcription factor [Candidatus Aminicenantes bacterium]
MKIRVLIIDDEKLARVRLGRMLQKFEEVEIAGETGDSLKAAELIAAAEPDAVFLDIHMPHRTGFEVLRELAAPPAVVFTTAYDSYALQAFEENAVDYLLKPVAEEKLDRAVAKLVRMFRSGESSRADLQRLLKQIERKEEVMRRFPVKTGDKIVIVPEERIQFFKAEDKYTFLHTETEAHIVAQTLRELEMRLDPAKFLRIHRAYIVNLEMIISIHHWFGGRLLVRTRKKEDIAVGANFLAKFKEKLHLK